MELTVVNALGTKKNATGDTFQVMDISFILVLTIREIEKREP